MDESKTIQTLGFEIVRLQAEIERLQRDLEIWRRNGGDDLMRAEIERLRALANSHAAMCERLSTERDELLAALQECMWLLEDLQSEPGLVQKKARAAIAKAEGK